jgi:hypothetical protein
VVNYHPVLVLGGPRVLLEGVIVVTLVLGLFFALSLCIDRGWRFAGRDTIVTWRRRSENGLIIVVVVRGRGLRCSLLLLARWRRYRCFSRVSWIN